VPARGTLSDCEYFFTLCARHQGAPFSDDVLATAVIDSLLGRKAQHHWRLYTACLMPDHLHFLVGLEPDEIRYVNSGARGTLAEGLLHHVAAFKSFTTTQVWWKRGGTRQLWQRSSYDRVIRHKESIQHAASYILENPVRKGIVKQWQDYPYSRIVDRW
jgi:REP element-mobilizing transposase RayT